MRLPGTGRGTSRRLVEGIRHPRNDCVGNVVHITQHAFSGNPQDPKPVFLDKLNPSIIELYPVGVIMRRAIDLDHKPFCKKAEVNHVRANRMVAAELKPARPQPQALPKHLLVGHHVLAQVPSEFDHRPCYKPGIPSTALCAVPLPVPGRMRDCPIQPSSLSFTTLPPCVRRIALPISSSSTGLPCSLSQKAERKL